MGIGPANHLRTGCPPGPVATLHRHGTLPLHRFLRGHRGHGRPGRAAAALRGDAAVGGRGGWMMVDVLWEDLGPKLEVGVNLDHFA